jgi:predicted GNAT family N-acyltransferase
MTIGAPDLVGPTRVTDRRTLEAIYRFRVAVWRQEDALAETAFPDGYWRDAFDDLSCHWVVNSGRGIAAAARLSIHQQLAEVPEAEEYLAAGLRLEGPIAASGRVVVASWARRRGLAARLLDMQDQEAREAGVRHGVRQASPAMRRLLERRGWSGIAPARPDARFTGVVFHIMATRYGLDGPEPPLAG